MPKVKIAITIDDETLERIDRLVTEERFANRSRAIQLAVEAALERLDRRRLARECARLDPRLERRQAEEGARSDLEEWPEY